MIYTTKQYLARYIGLHKNLDTAIHYILANDLSQLPLGKTEIQNDEVFVNVFEYVADNVLDEFYEGHETYLDIHTTIEGIEQTAGVQIENSTPKTIYHPAEDYQLFDGKNDYVTTIKKDHFLIVFPEDLHQPKIGINLQPVKKIVLKVKIG